MHGLLENRGLFWVPIEADAAVALLRLAYDAGVRTFDLTRPGVNSIRPSDAIDGRK